MEQVKYYIDQILDFIAGNPYIYYAIFALVGFYILKAIIDSLRRH